MNDIIAVVDGAIGHITLNRPKAINALTFDMAVEIARIMTLWKDDPAIVAILLDGAGERGFCAGGDIRALYDGAKSGDFASVDSFFFTEFRLNAQIGAYPKPVVAVMDGIVMGGGIGLGGHASHRVVTERSGLAMPECGIGYIPDVGGTYLLGRAPGETGTHLGLTAGRVNGGDAIFLGLADYFIPSASLGAILPALRDISDAEDLTARLAALSAEAPAGPLAAARGWIDEAYSVDPVTEIVSRLEARPEPEARAAAATIRKNSPRSLAVTLRALREARAFGNLDRCLEAEYHIAQTVVRGLDFVEGVRAAVVDKDRSPKWSPAGIGEVDPGWVENCFNAEGKRSLGLGGSHLPP